MIATLFKPILDYIISFDLHMNKYLEHITIHYKKKLDMVQDLI